MIISEIYVRRDGSTYGLRCTGVRCIDCARQLGLLRECPVCGKTPKTSGRLCAHSHVCNDYGTGRYYVSSVDVPEHLNVECVRWFDEDDVV